MADAMMPSEEDAYIANMDAMVQSDRESNIDAILQGYWRDYVDGLSNTIRARLDALIYDYHDADYIASTYGRADQSTKQLHYLLARLHRVWDHKDAVSSVHMLRMLRDNAPSDRDVWENVV
jgi:hypothetical protein